LIPQWQTKDPDPDFFVIAQLLLLGIFLDHEALAPVLLGQGRNHPGGGAGLGDAFRDILGPLEGPGHQHPRLTGLERDRRSRSWQKS
jgi:hypothetical protein